MEAKSQSCATRASRRRSAASSPTPCAARRSSKALNTLKFMPKKGAELVHKVLWSAVENAQNNQGADVDDLKVTRIMVDAAPQLKRFGSKAKGRGTRIIKRNSHITVVVGDGKKDE